MRIELPSPSWADTVQPTEDDAHTLTLATQPAPGWVQGAALGTDPAPALHTGVSPGEPLVVTLTF